MSNKNRIIIFFVFLTGSILGVLKLNKDFLLLWNTNKIEVTADSPLSAEKVKIEFGISVNSISRGNDSALFENRAKYSVLFDGKPKDPMINDYGENDFLITYDNKYYFSFRQFKFNRRHQHDYDFYLFQRSDTIFIKANIKGKDRMRFQRPMHKITMAAQLRCNSPIDEKKNHLRYDRND